MFVNRSIRSMNGKILALPEEQVLIDDDVLFSRCHRRCLPQPATRRRSITAHSSSICPYFRTIMSPQTLRIPWNRRRSNKKLNPRVLARRLPIRVHRIQARAVNCHCPLITRTRVHQDTRPVPTTCPEVHRAHNFIQPARNHPRSNQSRGRRVSTYWPSCRNPGNYFTIREYQFYVVLGIARYTLNDITICCTF